MSDDAKDVTTDDAEAPEAAAEATAEEPVAEEPVAEPAEEPQAGEPAVEPVEEPVAEERSEAAEEPAVEEPVAEERSAAAEEPAVEEPVAEEPVEEAEAEASGDADEASGGAAERFGPVRVARVYVCERAHRTTTVWGEPSTCQARPLRSGPQCGLPLYHITELPEQVQKALNPLKASKKASKKK